MEQTEADRLSGVLRLRFGSVEREVPALPLRPAKQWIALLVERLKSLSIGADADDEGALVRLTEQTTDAGADLVVAYDRTGILGGREWLDEHASGRDIRTALDVMREEALPFGDAAGLMALVHMAAKLATQNSTNGPSPTGDSPPSSSNRRSRRRS